MTATRAARLRFCAAIGLTLLAAHPMGAATSTGNLNVTATVANACTVATSALDFSLLNQGTTSNEATPGEVTLNCTASQTGTTVTLDGGQNETAGQRRLQASGNFISYSIFSDASHTSPISVGGTLYSGDITAATPLQLFVYGQVPSGSYVAGTYNDVIVVTLTY